MSLADLPNELLLEIASKFTSDEDFASFVQVNRRFYETLISSLYRRDAKYSNGFAMRRAVETQNLSALEKALKAWRHVNKSAKLPCLGFPNYTLLIQAVEDSNLAEVQLLLAYGADPNDSDMCECTPLGEAVLQGDLAVVEELLWHENIDLDSCRPKMFALVYLALLMGRGEVVQMLLARSGYPGSLRHRHLETPLYSAVKYKEPDMVRLFVNRDDVDPNALSGGFTPLEFAVMENMEDIVEILLTDKRVNPDLTTSPPGKTPLFVAALNKNDRLVQMLLDARAGKGMEDTIGISPAMLLKAPSAKARTEIIREAILLKYPEWAE